MGKNKIKYKCCECEYISAKWLGQCPQCGQWNSFAEESINKNKTNLNIQRMPYKISEINESSYKRVNTNVREFDRVLGGGITIGSLVLIGGEPGVGKSTLLLEICGRLSGENVEILYVSGEESSSQVASRAKRLGVNKESFYILNETSWENILEQIKKIKPMFLVLDSIQTTVTAEVQSHAGTMTQIREVTYELMNYAKANNVTCFIVGHITKDGNIAGPKILEHMVDTVLYFEGDPLGQYRLLRTVKNRFGSTNEVGIFEMSSTGLKQIENPSLYFTDDSENQTYGRSVTCVLEGMRSIFLEIQALVVENQFNNPRRTTQGIDINRLALLVAVIDKYFEIPISRNDVYVNVVGGMRLGTRESDLSIIASIISSFYSAPMMEKTLFVGEVGLTGEVRPVPMIEQRIKEAQQMNYERVITSSRNIKKMQQNFSIKIHGIKNALEIKPFLKNNAQKFYKKKLKEQPFNITIP